MYICMCICVHTRVCVYIYMYIYTHTSRKKERAYCQTPWDLPNVVPHLGTKNELGTIAADIHLFKTILWGSKAMTGSLIL